LESISAVRRASALAGVLLALVGCDDDTQTVITGEPDAAAPLDSGAGGEPPAVPDASSPDASSPGAECPSDLPAVGSSCALAAQRCYYCDDASAPGACQDAVICTSELTWQNRSCPSEPPAPGEACLTVTEGSEPGEPWCVYGACGEPGGIQVSECTDDQTWTRWNNVTCPASDAGADAASDAQ
jgi:hypothetical protein